MKIATRQISASESQIVVSMNDSFFVEEASSQFPSFEQISRLARDKDFNVLNSAAEVDSASFGPPFRNSRKVICVGRNYSDHAKEMGGEAPEIPVIFNKFPSAITGPGKVRLPAISQQVDYEAELVVVIGKQGNGIPRSEAMEYVFGYTCGNDVSARDWQKGRPGGQWLLGKSFDDFAPIGPWLVTKDEIADPHRLQIELRLNGSVVQSACTSQLIFPIDELISHVSKFTTLEPGDLLFTGTPAGVGAGKNPPVFLKAGDVTEVTIEGIGTLTNQFVSKADFDIS